MTLELHYDQIEPLQPEHKEAALEKHKSKLAIKLDLQVKFMAEQDLVLNNNNEHDQEILHDWDASGAMSAFTKAFDAVWNAEFAALYESNEEKALEVVKQAFYKELQLN